MSVPRRQHRPRFESRSKWFHALAKCTIRGSGLGGNRPRSAGDRLSPEISGAYAMDLGLSGRRAIVCASSRGLGRACAQALAAAGCEVVINGLDAARLEATANELRKTT